MKKSKYLLRYHDFYYRRIATLKEQVQHLKATLRRINLSGTKSSNLPPESVTPTNTPYPKTQQERVSVKGESQEIQALQAGIEKVPSLLLFFQQAPHHLVPLFER